MPRLATLIFFGCAAAILLGINALIYYQIFNWCSIIILATSLAIISSIGFNKARMNCVAKLEELTIKYRQDQLLIKTLEEQIATDAAAHQKNEFDTSAAIDIKNSVAQIENLSSIISGINHEISPWLGGIANTVSRLSQNLTELNEEYNTENCEVYRKKCVRKYAEIEKACRQGMDILQLLSRNVKKLKNYSNDNYILADTVTSWCILAVRHQKVKENLNPEDFTIDESSLNFSCIHSPMHLTQIILNLTFNSIDHNVESLESLHIKIYGNKKTNTLYFEDNGKGIPMDLLGKIFEPGFSTSGGTTATRGFGLAACTEYARAMRAILTVESQVGQYTRFALKFTNQKKYLTEEFDVYRTDSDVYKSIKP